MATVDMSCVEQTYKDQFFPLIQSMVQKVVIAPNPEKGVDLQVHGRLATILAAMDAWKEEEAKLTQEVQQEYIEKIERGEIRTEAEEAAFLERVNAEMAERASRFSFVQASVVAGVGFEPTTFRL